MIICRHPSIKILPRIDYRRARSQGYSVLRISYLEYPRLEEFLLVPSPTPNPQRPNTLRSHRGLPDTPAPLWPSRPGKTVEEETNIE